MMSPRKNIKLSGIDRWRRENIANTKILKKVKIINEIKKSHLDSETNSNKGIEMIMVIYVVFSLI